MVICNIVSQFEALLFLAQKKKSSHKHTDTFVVDSNKVVIAHGAEAAWGGGGSKMAKFLKQKKKKKPKIKSVGWQHMRVDNNKTNNKYKVSVCGIWIGSLIYWSNLSRIYRDSVFYGNILYTPTLEAFFAGHFKAICPAGREHLITSTVGVKKKKKKKERIIYDKNNKQSTLLASIWKAHKGWKQQNKNKAQDSWWWGE
mgnify:CR=1 FL=1